MTLSPSSSSSTTNNTNTTVNKISEWTLFALFIHTVCEQIQGLFDILIRLSSSSSSTINTTDTSPSFMQQFTTSDMNTFLQLMHTIGIVIGLGLRGGVFPYLTLPSDFYARLANDLPTPASPTTPTTAAMRQQNGYLDHIQSTFLSTIAMALRRGICSIYPETVWDFWTTEEITFLFTGQMYMNTANRSTAAVHHKISPMEYSLPQIIHTTSYDPTISIQDKHVQFFWLAIYELSEQQRQLIWNHIFLSTAPAAAGTAAATPSRRLHIMKPTATACLSPDTTSIMIFPNLLGISLPKYSSFQYMQLYVQELLQSLQQK